MSLCVYSKHTIIHLSQIILINCKYNHNSGNIFGENNGVGVYVIHNSLNSDIIV